MTWRFDVVEHLLLTALPVQLIALQGISYSLWAISLSESAFDVVEVPPADGAPSPTVLPPPRWPPLLRQGLKNGSAFSVSAALRPAVIQQLELAV